MAQVYRFTDENGQVRLFAEIDPTPGAAGGTITGPLVITPSGAGVPLTINLPAGADTAYRSFIEGYCAGDQIFSVDAAGDLNLNSTVALAGTLYVGERTNGQFWFVASSDDFSVKDAINNVPLFDIDPINHKVGFFDKGGFSGGATQQTIAAVGGLQALYTALVNYGLLASGTTLNALTPKGLITSGALPTATLSSGTGAQILTTRDVETVTPFTGDGTNNAATCAIALSPDNVTYSTLATISIAAALNLTGVLTDTVNVRVPAGWYVKLTASHGTVGTTTYY